MDAEFFTACFVAAVKSELSGQALIHFLHVIECDAENIQLNEKQTKIVSQCLHQIYAKNAYSARASVLRIICSLEIQSEDPILEENDFDLLIASSLKAAPPDPIPKVDEEKSSAFRNILIQLKGRQDMPNSLARALVTIYNSPQNNYKTLIFGCLCEIIFATSKINCSHEIMRIIVDKYAETADQRICDTLSYCLEKKSPYVSGKHSISRLIVPLTSLTQQKREVAETCTKALILLLRSWPGFLGFAVCGRVFEDFAHCMNHETVAISQLLMDLIHPYEASPNVLDGYTGFLLHCLKHSGLYDEINKSTPVRPALENLKKRLLPYSSTYSQIANRGNSELKDSTLSASEVIYNVGWPLSIPKIQSTQPDISGNSSDWDWTMIHAYLTIVLPNNEAEAKAQEHIKFYNELFEYFSGAFLNTQPPQTQLIADSLFALIDLLLPRDWGKTIIENSTSIKNALTLSVHSLRKHDNPRNDTPAWSHLKCVTNLMKSSAGVEVLKKWNIQPALLDLSSHITNLPAAKLTMSMLNLYPEFEFVSPVFSKFLASPNIEISNIAVDSLRDKRQKTKNFFQTAFKSLVVPYLKTAAEMPDAAKRMPMILSAFFEFLVDDKEAIEYAAQDVDVHKILTKWGPLGYAILFSSQKSLKLCDPPGLVKWWMEDGNHLYLKAFDLASEASFTGKLKEASLSIPDIIVKGKSLMTPPHLFGELSKHEQGVELIKPYIPTLIQQCTSKSSRDAREAFFALAHFASSPLTTKIVEENDIPNVMLQAVVNSNSLMLRGTLISCFSLFAQSDYFTKFLISNNWEVIKFGEHQAVVPSDPYAFAHRSEHSDKITINDIPVPAGHEEVCNTLIGLLSPLTSNQCRQTLSNYKAELKLPEVVLFAHSLIGEYPFPDELRKQLELIIEGTPLHVLTEESIKEIDPQLLSEAEARFEIIDKRGFNEPEGMRTFPLTN